MPRPFGRPPGAKDASLLQRASDALEDGRLEDALTAVQEGLAAAPRDLGLLHLKALAEVALGEIEAAAASFDAATQAKDAHAVLLADGARFYVEHADGDFEWLERGLTLARRGAKLAAKDREDELLAEHLFTQGAALLDLGEASAAIEPLDQALALQPDWPELAQERAVALFEALRFPEARGAFTALLEADPDDPLAHHYLALVLERAGDQAAARHFERARALAPLDYPAPVQLGPEEFDRVVKEAVAGLPAEVKEHLQNTSFVVEDLPSEEDLRQSDPPLSPASLGMFHGTPVGQRSVTNPFDHFPTKIVLYSKNLERAARTRDELVEQIQTTVLHEIGHLVGLDERDLWERGLD